MYLQQNEVEKSRRRTLRHGEPVMGRICARAGKDRPFLCRLLAARAAHSGVGWSHRPTQRRRGKGGTLGRHLRGCSRTWRLVGAPGALRLIGDEEDGQRETLNAPQKQARVPPPPVRPREGGSGYGQQIRTARVDMDWV